MASFAAQAALRSRWSSLIESTSIDVPGEVTDGVRSVVGWLKQASLEVRQVGRRAVTQLSGGGMGDEVVILHFNDVYNIEPTSTTEPVGGALRFSTAIKSLQHLRPLVLFSGDIFSPSMLSTYTRGEQMVPVLTAIGTHCAVFGNHDFDFGLERLAALAARCEFPWLMSNVLDNETGRPLGDGRVSHALLAAGRRIGLIGLVEQEWLETLATINPEEVTFIDFIQAGAELAAQLKEEGCEYVIALTHMRSANDLRLARADTGIDLILGGHDHVYEVQQVNNKYIIKSGTDFRQFSKITIKFDGPPGARGSAAAAPRADSGAPRARVVDVAEVAVTSAFAEDLELKTQLDKYTALVEGKMDEVLGEFAVPLEGRFSVIRRQETNLGSWVCDALLAATGADLLLLNSGTFRSDQVHPAGPFRLRDLAAVLPAREPLLVLQVSGAVLLQALENAVSRYPSLEGRFPQVAGVAFAFDPAQPPGRRVPAAAVRVGAEYLRPERQYRLAVKPYLHAGHDGYSMLRACPVLVPEELCPEAAVALQNHLEAVTAAAGSAPLSRHRQPLLPPARRPSLVKLVEPSEHGGPPQQRRGSAAEPPPPHLRAGPAPGGAALAPRVRGRILLIDGPEKLQQLLAERARREAGSDVADLDDPTSP